VKEVSKPKEPGIALGVALIALLAGLLSISVIASDGVKPGTMRDGVYAVTTGVYLMAWGAMFVASYYFDHKTFFFRALIWVCVHMSRPKGRGMAFFYAALCFALGGVAILAGLGVIDVGGPSASSTRWC
jgi:hypothetical protein